MDKEMMTEIGKRIAKLRQEKGMNQSEFADICEFGRSNLARIENGEVNITTKTLLKLSSVFEISIDWLLTGKGFKFSIDIEDADAEIKVLLEEMGKDKLLKHHILGTLYAYLERKKTSRESGTNEQGVV
jgi:transcriptional regulator with XRE-family HTH domain